MALSADRIKNYFTRQPLPRSAFQISSRYISGIHVSPKEGKVKNYFILPLEKGVIQPSFYERNIKNPAVLEKAVKEGLEKLNLSERKTACFIPELSLKAFVFSFNSLPASQQEREKVIRFRVKKQVPLLPEDTRFSFDLIRSNDSTKVVSVIARSAVVQEYEDFFAKLRLRVKAVGIPTLSLYNLMNKEKERDALLINIEEDSLSLIAVINSEIVLYRQKPFILSSQSDFFGPQAVETIVKEVENTVNFVEDTEKRKIQSFRVRLGLMHKGKELFSLLNEKSSFPFKGIKEGLTSKLGSEERQILSPLFGQIL
jgi:hypothetical protein